jgi:hypothetical protein
MTTDRTDRRNLPDAITLIAGKDFEVLIGRIHGEMIVAARVKPYVPPASRTEP